MHKASKITKLMMKNKYKKVFLKHLKGHGFSKVLSINLNKCQPLYKLLKIPKSIICANKSLK